MLKTSLSNGNEKWKKYLHKLISLAIFHT